MSLVCIGMRMPHPLISKEERTCAPLQFYSFFFVINKENIKKGLCIQYFNMK